MWMHRMCPIRKTQSCQVQAAGKSVFGLARERCDGAAVVFLAVWPLVWRSEVPWWTLECFEVDRALAIMFAALLYASVELHQSCRKSATQAGCHLLSEFAWQSLKAWVQICAVLMPLQLVVMRPKAIHQCQRMTLRRKAVALDGLDDRDVSVLSLQPIAAETYLCAPSP